MRSTIKFLLLFTILYSTFSHLILILFLSLFSLKIFSISNGSNLASKPELVILMLLEEKLRILIRNNIVLVILFLFFISFFLYIFFSLKPYINDTWSPSIFFSKRNYFPTIFWIKSGSRAFFLPPLFLYFISFFSIKPSLQTIVSNKFSFMFS